MFWGKQGQPSNGLVKYPVLYIYFNLIFKIVLSSSQTSPLRVASPLPLYPRLTWVRWGPPDIPAWGPCCPAIWTGPAAAATDGSGWQTGADRIGAVQAAADGCRTHAVGEDGLGMRVKASNEFKLQIVSVPQYKSLISPYSTFYPYVCCLWGRTCAEAGWGGRAFPLVSGKWKRYFVLISSVANKWEM